jgi:hypothetical protein
MNHTYFIGLIAGAILASTASTLAAPTVYSIDIGHGTPRSGQQDGAYAQMGSWNRVSLNGGGGSNTITVNNLVDGTGTATSTAFIFNDNGASYAYFWSADGATMSMDLGQHLATTGNMNWKFTGLAANTTYNVWGTSAAHGGSGGLFAGPAIGTPGQPNGTKYPWGSAFTMTTDGDGSLWGSWGNTADFSYAAFDAMQIQEVSNDLAAHAGADQALSPSSPTAVLGGDPAASGGTPGYTYIWSPADGLSDATVANPTVTTTAATTTYTLTVTDSGSELATDEVVVTYTVPPLVADAGVDKSVFSSFPSVMIGGTPAASGGTPGLTPPYTYSWSPLEGLDDPTLANPTASPTSTTTYTLTVKDSVDVEATDSMTVTYILPPSNDNFADAITLPGNSGTQTGTNNVDATSQVDEPAFKAGYENPNLQKTVWFKWTCAESGTFNLSTAGSTNTAGAAWDAVVYIYDGDSLATLNQLAFSDNDYAETVAQPVSAGVTYHIRLSWGGGPSGNPAAEMNATNLLLSWSLAPPIMNRPDVISIDVVSEGSTAVSGDVAGSPVTGQSGLWNRLVGNNMPVVLSDLKNGAGDTVSNIGFTAAYTGGSFQQFQPNSDITGGPATGVVLAADSPERLDISGSTAALTFAFTNLPPGDTYALVIYNTAYSAGVLTINGGTPHTNVPTVLTTYEVADGEGKITGVATFNGATHSGYFALSGFQLYALGSTPSGYDSWAADHAGNQTPDLDYDHDGVSNGVEYFMGAPDGFTNNPGLLNGRVTWPHLNPVAAFAVQVSANLSEWSPADPLDVDTTSDPGLVIYTLPKGASKKFCRLVVTP